MNTIKLGTNIPVRGTIKYCDYSKSKREDWADQICLKGTWDGEEGRVYLPLGVLDQLFDLKLLAPRNESDRWGNPAYMVLGDGPVEICKTEGEDGRKFTYVKLINDGGQPTPDPAEADRRESRAGSPPSRQNAPQNGASPAKKPDISNSRANWVAMRDMMTACLRLADQAWAAAYENEPYDLGNIQATAHCFFIEGNRKGLKLEPRNARREEYDGADDGSIPF